MIDELEQFNLTSIERKCYLSFLECARKLNKIDQITENVQKFSKILEF